MTRRHTISSRKTKMAMCNDLFTCELSQAAALAATMQGHAGLQGPAKALVKGQKGARDVSLNPTHWCLHKSKDCWWTLTPTHWIASSQLKPASQLSSVHLWGNLPPSTWPQLLKSLHHSLCPRSPSFFSLQGSPTLASRPHVSSLWRARVHCILWVPAVS